MTTNKIKDLEKEIQELDRKIVAIESSYYSPIKSLECDRLKNIRYNKFNELKNLFEESI